MVIIDYKFQTIVFSVIQTVLFIGQQIQMLNPMSKSLLKTGPPVVCGQKWKKMDMGQKHANKNGLEYRRNSRTTKFHIDLEF